MPGKTESKDKNKDEKENEKSSKSFFSRKPPKECTLKAGEDHPQRAIMMERERLRPCANLEAWFDAGLVKEYTGDMQALERSRRKAKIEKDIREVVRGLRPMPTGYSGCDGDTILVEANMNNVLIWPIRLDIGEMSADHQQPLTLYHYCHENSFEHFHNLFHDISKMDPLNFRREMYALLQADFQERVPNPTPQNVKGEPQLSPIEPIKFQSKEEILVHVFGKNSTGFSKLGNAWTSFADYCIAIRAPASACFTIATHGAVAQSGANVRLCKDTMEQMTQRMERAREIARQQHGKELSKRAGNAKKQEDAGESTKTGCFGRFCGSKQKVPEFWDDVPDRKDENKKEKREVDRWKQRLARQWLNDHISTMSRRQSEEKKKKKDDPRVEEKKKVNQEQVKSKPKADLRVAEKVKVKTPALFDSPGKFLNKFSSLVKRPSGDGISVRSKREKDPAVPVKDVTSESHLFAGYDKRLKKGGSLGTGEMEVGPAVAQVADAKIKQFKQSKAVESNVKRPTGNQRHDIHKKKHHHGTHHKTKEGAEKEDGKDDNNLRKGGRAQSADRPADNL